MSWWNWKKEKEEEKELRTFTVKPEDTAEVMRLIGEMQTKTSAFTRYNFWSHIEELFPETREGTWQWRINRCTVMEIREVLEK